MPKLFPGLLMDFFDHITPLSDKSLAEAYMEAGDTNSAIRSYERSMDLDPDNDEVKQVLKELNNN